MTFLLIASISPVNAAFSASANEDSTFFDEVTEKLKAGKKGKLGTHYYWDDGLHIDSPTKKLRRRLNMLLNLDVGKIYADDALDTAFPGLEGTELELLRAGAERGVLILTRPLCLQGQLCDRWENRPNETRNSLSGISTGIQ